MSGDLTPRKASGRLGQNEIERLKAARGLIGALVGDSEHATQNILFLVLIMLFAAMFAALAAQNTQFFAPLIPAITLICGYLVGRR